MNFYADLNIRNKLFLGFAAVVSLTFAIGIFGYYRIHFLDKADDFLFHNGIIPLENIGEISSDFQRLRSNIRELILARGHNETYYYHERVLKYREGIDLKVRRLEWMLPDAESKKLFARLVQVRNEYTPHISRIVEYSRKNKHDEAWAYLKSAAIATAERAEIDAIETLQEYLVKNAEKISDQNSATSIETGRIILALAFGSVLLAIVVSRIITGSITRPLRRVLDVVTSQEEGGRERARLVAAIAGGDLTQEVRITEPLILDTDQVSSDEVGTLLKAIAGMSRMQHVVDQAFVGMTASLRHGREQEVRYREEETLRSWLKNGFSELNTILLGDKTNAELTEQTLSFLCRYLGTGVGVFYEYNDREETLQIAASYAFNRQNRLCERISLGEGLAGQVALERKMIFLNSVPPDYLPIRSALGEAQPVSILVLPLLQNDVLVGILEFGSFNIFKDSDLEFLNRAMAGIALAHSINKSRQRVNELLEETQSQAEELRVQQEQLQQTNEELEERAQLLEQQREQIRAQNLVMEAANREVQRKADELERISTYKSEFLANMSHELRTPLNSLMILSSLLKDNREGNLTDKQVGFAATINGAGRDLLMLINDILDLSKIESGHMDFYYEELTLSEICEQLKIIFTPVTGDKGINFSVGLDDSAPNNFHTDGQRTQQILKNLLSNACKFTSKGSISLRAYTPSATENPLKTPALAFAVTDSGIGIPLEKQSIIFNAFQQADGTTSRTFGGTGLGLSISRQLARSMGGEISLNSEPEKGSTFTLYLPLKGSSLPATPIPVAPLLELPPPADINPEYLAAPIPDDREKLQEGGRSILIIEDDLVFAGILVNMVRSRGFSALVADDGEIGILLAERYQPGAIILDVMLPSIDGWGVMRSLKDNPGTRHIPVHFLTCLEERQKAMTMGAIGFVTKPASSEQLDTVFKTLEASIEKTMKKLLIVEDNQDQAAAMIALLEERDVTITVADSGAKAIELLSSLNVDCIVLDLGLPDMGAFELLDKLKKLASQRRIPVIIHTGRELTNEDEQRLHHYAESIIIKGAKSPERLLNEVTLFLHQVETSLAPGKQRMLRASLDKEAMLEGKKVLIVDDDMRNIFSLTSALEEKDIIIFAAENGMEALKRLDEHPDIDLVLMDIMMPQMDGFDATRRIRKDPRFSRLPIIALTAKAMKGDRDECLKAGASDYIPKPVDMKKLFSLLRVWLYSATAYFD